MEKENPEYLVSYVNGRSGMPTLGVYIKKPQQHIRAIYQVRAEKEVLDRSYETLFAIMKLAGEVGTGGFSAVLDRESILAVVPEWEKII